MYLTVKYLESKTQVESRYRGAKIQTIPRLHRSPLRTHQRCLNINTRNQICKSLKPETIRRRAIKQTKRKVKNLGAAFSQRPFNYVSNVKIQMVLMRKVLQSRSHSGQVSKKTTQKPRNRPLKLRAFGPASKRKRNLPVFGQVRKIKSYHWMMMIIMMKKAR